MSVPEQLNTDLEVLRIAFPGALARQEYEALLVAVEDELCEENLALLVAALIDGEPIVVANDAANQRLRRGVPEEAVGAMRERLSRAGWQFDDERGR